LLERVHLDLVHRRHDLVVDDQIHDTVRLVVADADGTDAAIAKHSLHRTPGAVNVTERLMDQVEVEIVEPEALQGPLERGLRALLALVLDPQLGGDEDLLARDAAGPDRLADRFLVAIGRSRIYQPVTDRQRVRNAPLALLRVGNLEHTEPEDRHLYAVVERNRGNRNHPSFSFSAGCHHVAPASALRPAPPASRCWARSTDSVGISPSTRYRSHRAGHRLPRMRPPSKHHGR